jgi:hypothetical protein
MPLHPRRWMRLLVQALRRCIKRGLGRPLRIHIENRWRMGDEILALPLYTLLRRRFPDADISVSVNFPELVHAAGDDVRVDNACGEFDADRFIFLKDDARDIPRLQNLCRIARVPYAALEPAIRMRTSPLLAKPVSSCLRIGYTCGAGWVCKSWSTGFLRQLASALSRESRAVEFVEFGKQCPGASVGQDLRDKLTLEQTAAAIATCGLFIGPDTGLVHLALALGVPAIGLYGPVRPDKAFGPRAQLHAVTAPAACAGCWTDARMTQPGVCPLSIRSDAPEEYPCMRSITPELVLARLRELNLLCGGA